MPEAVSHATSTHTGGVPGLLGLQRTRRPESCCDKTRTRDRAELRQECLTNQLHSSSSKTSTRAGSPGFVAGRYIVPAIRDAVFNTDVLADRFHELPVHRRQTCVGLQIERLEPLGDLIEERCSPIVALQRFPVLGLPGRGQLDITNAAPDALPDRRTEPLDTLRRLDQVAIAPVFFVNCMSS